MKRTLMCTIAVVTLTFSSAVYADDYPNAHLIVDANALAGMIDDMSADSDLRIIDVRPTADFAAGHLPGAISLPFTMLTDPNGHMDGALKSYDALAALIGAAGIDAGSTIVIYDDRGGFRAARLFWLLEYFGHRDVMILDGGIPAWTATGYDIAHDGNADVAAPDPGQPVFPVALTPRRHASADWILERREDDETVVVDVRPTDLYDAGHIPWAQNVPWSLNLDEDGTMLDPDALAAHFAAFGVNPEDNIVIHCQTGEASAHSYFALRLLGYDRVRVYHRSWAEWGTAGDLPIAISDDAT